jgi:hypothetical protein
MCWRSKVIREACEKDPTRSAFDVVDVLGFHNIFQSVVQYVHEDVVPIGPGGVVGWFSNEAQRYIEQMLRLYRFAIKYEMEDLADRTMDELQDHEKRCGGRLCISQIQEAYEGSGPGSKMRLYCAVGLYQWMISTKMNSAQRPRCRGFLILRHVFPEIEVDIYRAADMYEQKAMKEKVDYRDRSSFGSCVFHTHKKGDSCSATDPGYAELRVGEPSTTVRIPIIITTGYEDSELEDDGSDVEVSMTSSGLEDGGKATAETTSKCNSPGFEDSGVSVEDEMSAVPRDSSIASKNLAPNYIGGSEPYTHTNSPNQLPKSKSRSKSKKPRKVIQSPPHLVVSTAVQCRACDQEFPSKEKLLEHFARKKADRNHRMGGRSFSLNPDGSLVPLRSKRVRLDF